MRRLILWVVGCLYLGNAIAIGVADFIPNFLAVETGGKKSTGSYVSSSPNVNGVVVVTESANTTNKYCSGTNVNIRDSIFCQPQYESSIIINNQVDIATASSSQNSSQTHTDPNLSAMQTNYFRNAIGKYGSNYMLSIKPTDNMNVGIGATDKGVNALQFNIKY